MSHTYSLPEVNGAAVSALDQKVYDLFASSMPDWNDPDDLYRACFAMAQAYSARYSIVGGKEWAHGVAVGIVFALNTRARLVLDS